MGVFRGLKLCFFSVDLLRICTMVPCSLELPAYDPYRVAGIAQLDQELTACSFLSHTVRPFDDAGDLPVGKKNPRRKLILGGQSDGEIEKWAYADASWACIGALVPIVVSSAIESDEVANKILHELWPGSYCDTSSGCCYPTYGKPQSDFAIYAIISNGGHYMLDSIITALTSCLGHVPGIGCNQDSSGRYQLHLVYLCINPSGTVLMDCPVYPSSGCGSSVVYFPSF
ncbi:hypothetical protein LUZ63_012265 [Rhynchospora breviuscula]|uniref:Uncharacterized protein n=1 Tax=Rhynchospora breviuscula TaxID=2022672 RepID=A0A9Q0CKC4_9POAL|nr:hypothetical protein LUZ63_012265 [Rhynchospora breviuscula]